MITCALTFHYSYLPLKDRTPLPLPQEPKPYNALLNPLTAHHYGDMTCHYTTYTQHLITCNSMPSVSTLEQGLHNHLTVQDDK